MKYNANIIKISTAVVALLSGISYSQPKSKSAKPTLPKVSKPQATKAASKVWVASSDYDELPFDLSTSKLPPNYQGHNTEEIFKLLEPRLKGKGEFEKTEDYIQRKTEALRKPLWGKLTPNSVLAITTYIDPVYSADQEQYKVEAFLNEVPSGITGGGTESTGSILGSSTTLSSRIYTGENLFGVKKDIVSDVSRCFRVALQGINGLPLTKTDYDNPFTSTIRFDFTLSPAEAKSAKGKMELLLLYSLSEPCVTRDVDYHKPTIDFPMETKNYDQYLIGQVKEVWVFNKETGQIYSKLKSTASEPIIDSGGTKSSVDFKGGDL